MTNPELPPAQTVVSPEDFSPIYDRFVARIDAEDALIDNRVQWLLVSQGLLFTAFGFSSAGSGPSSSPSVDRALDTLPWLGMLSSLLLFVSIVAAFATAADARKRVTALYLNITDAALRTQHQEVCAFPQASRRTWHFYGGFIAPLALPLLFATGWLLLLVI